MRQWGFGEYMFFKEFKRSLSKAETMVNIQTLDSREELTTVEQEHSIRFLIIQVKCPRSISNSFDPTFAKQPFNTASLVSQVPRHHEKEMLESNEVS